MSKELVERLRTEAKLRHGIPQGSEFGERDLRILAHEPRWEAADRIEALEAQNLDDKHSQENLRKVLNWSQERREWLRVENEKLRTALKTAREAICAGCDTVYAIGQIDAALSPSGVDRRHAAGDRFNSAGRYTSAADAADRIEALEAEVERLKSALSEISRQKTSAEHTDYLQFVEEADVVGGYDEVIRVARAALSPSDKGE